MKSTTQQPVLFGINGQYCYLHKMDYGYLITLEPNDEKGVARVSADGKQIIAIYYENPALLANLNAITQAVNVAIGNLRQPKCSPDHEKIKRGIFEATLIRSQKTFVIHAMRFGKTDVIGNVGIYCDPDISTNVSSPSLYTCGAIKLQLTDLHDLTALCQICAERLQKMS